jgi:hypothetical protein
LRAGGQCECITPKVRGVLKVPMLRCAHVGRCNAVLREPWSSVAWMLRDRMI